MPCANCGEQNPPAARFCNHCGTALAATCAQCGHSNPRASRFCSECGGPLATPALEPRFASPQQYTPPSLADRIRADRSALEGEYKQVTVLFADVEGFTALASTRDPEETYAFMQRCFDLMLEAVHQYEGTVTQFLGDGILALFGAPIAHEDHAQRAVRAALGIQQALRAYQQQLQQSRGIHFQMRIGLNSGLVVVGTIGTDLNMTYTAIGDTVNLGSRVEGLAEPGTVAISQSTYRLVSDYFDTRALGEHSVKGKEQAVRAYEVLRPRRPRSRVQVSADRGLTPLVGRQPELETLLDRYSLARSGRGQIVFLRGEAGIGKSRLLYEFRRGLEQDGVTWLEGRCISFGKEIAYLPIIDLLKDHFEIGEADTEAQIISRVEAGVQAVGTEMAQSPPFLKYLLSVDPGDASVTTMDPQMRKLRLFEALRDLLLTASHGQGLVVAVEDLHWMDPVSEEFLASFAGALESHPILLILTARGGYAPGAGFPPSFTSIGLSSLSEQESAAVAQGHLGIEEMPRELQDLICRKAEGNPFYVEEVTKSLVEVGAIRRCDTGYVLTRSVAEILVPDTIQDVIMARLDRLAEAPKRAMQTASVIGREFTVRLLERTSEVEEHIGEYLRELKSVELIFESALHPELAFMFKHALTHDVAYTSLLVARRKALHRLVGDAVEVIYSERLSEQYETLAYHYEHAEAWEKAPDYLQKSGDKAMAAFAPQQAIDYYDRALAILEKPGTTLPPERMTALHYARAQALFQKGDWDNSIASAQAMLQIAVETGEQFQEGMALVQLGMTSFVAHRFEDALEYAERSRALAMSTQDPGVLAGSHLVVLCIRAVTGDLTSARGEAEALLAITRRADIPGIEAFGHAHEGLMDHWKGDAIRAVEVLDKAILIGRRYQIAEPLLFSIWFKALAQVGGGQYEEALQSLREHLEFCGRTGGTYFRCRSLNTLGWLYMDLCHWELAIQFNSQGAEEARPLGDPEIIRNVELNLADCYLVVNRLDEAQRLLEGVHEECRRPCAWGQEHMKWRYTQHLNASLGDLWMARGNAEKALEFADACLAAAIATESRRNIVKGRRLKGEAFLFLDRLEDAETEIVEALRVAREVGNPAQLRLTLAVLGRLRQAQGRLEEARAAYLEAISVVEVVAASLSDAALRSALLASPQVAALRESAL